jgi:penicillin-binding protein 1A
MADAYGTWRTAASTTIATAVSKVEFPNGKVDEPDPDSGEAGPHGGRGLRRDEDPRGRDHPGHRAGYTYTGCSAAAGKTGTSEGESDAWFVGYTPLLSTAVWVGHPESRDLTGFGGPTAGPIWSSYMSAALAGNCPDFQAPSSLPDLSAYTSGPPRPTPRPRLRPPTPRPTALPPRAAAVSPIRRRARPSALPRHSRRRPPRRPGSRAAGARSATRGGTGRRRRRGLSLS